MFSFPWKEVVTPNGVMFWGLFAALSLIIWLTMKPKDNLPVRYATLATSGFLLLMLLFGPERWVRMVHDDPKQAAAWGLGYVLAGVLFGWFKWNSFLSRRKEKLQERIRDWMQEHHADLPADDVPDPFMAEFKSSLAGDKYWTVPVKKKRAEDVGIFEHLWRMLTDYSYNHDVRRNAQSTERRVQIIPQVWYFKSQWTAWAAWWPWAMSYYVVFELGRNIFNVVWAQVSGWMNWWSEYRFRKYKKYE